jgi:hypothetical protein
MTADDGDDDPIARAFEEGTPIDEALAEGVREALKRHKLAGNPVCVWRDGKVVWIPPEEIPIDEPPPPKR